jgi:predicted phage terminase large subunit-like protein
VGLIDFARETAPGYLAGWFHHELGQALEEFSGAVARGESPRLMIFVPPRHGKSLLVSERWPVWHLGHHPAHHVVAASYGQDLSTKFSRRARSIARSRTATRRFPDLVLDAARTAVQEWETTLGGSFKAVGIGSALTGSGAHVLVIDDPVKDAAQAASATYREAVWEWYTHTAYTRLMPGGGVLLVMTRWHEDDLAGRLLAAEAAGGDRWRVIRYPAIAEEPEPHRAVGEALHPERFSVERLERIRGAVGSRAWAALYQQRPSRVEGNLIRRAWWRFYREAPSLAQFDTILQSWDLSFKAAASSDYVVGQVWGRRGADRYLLDQVRDRLDFSSTVQAIRAMRAKWPQAGAILVEDKANGPAVISALGREIPGLIPVNPAGSKEARVAAVSPAIEAGNVWLPDPELAPWVGDLLEEASAFPRGAHDDQVDALTQALHRFDTDTTFDYLGVSY